MTLRAALRQRTRWSWKLRLYPLVALLIAGGSWFADTPEKRAAGSASRPRQDGGHTVRSPSTMTAISGVHNGTAIDCSRHPLITLCNRQTKERR